LGYHFLYANLAGAQSKQDILDMTALQFTFPSSASKNFDALFDHMTDALHKSGAQPGFVLVLEHIPAHAKFDKESREQLLDVFREAAEYWSERKISFRCFYSFSVARAAACGSPNRRHANHGHRFRRRRENAYRQIGGRVSLGFAHEQPFQRWLLAVSRLTKTGGFKRASVHGG
jgi:RNAse (barnase) inhibitor barstar